MENTRQFNPNLGTIAMERILDRESAPLRRLPHPKNGDQTTEVDIRPNPHVAQDLVAGLEGPSSEDLRLRCQGRRSRLNQTRLIRINDPDSTKSYKEKIKWKTHAS